MKTVLVTGATGFIGRQSLRALKEEGFRVCAVTSQRSPPRTEGVDWYTADLLDSDCASEVIRSTRPTHLLHFAWYAVPGQFWKSPQNFRWVRATLALLEAFRDSGGQRIVSAGTCAEYDWNYGACIEERTPLKPASLYGVCKNAMQGMHTEFCQRMGLSGAWGRVFHLYGPYEHPDRLTAAVINSLLVHSEARCSHGNQIRDFMHVQDVAEAFVALLQSDVNGPVNIASGRPIAVRDVILKIAERLQQRDLVRFGAIPAGADDPMLLIADTQRLREEVRWKPRYDLDSGLEQTIHWWQEQHRI